MPSACEAQAARGGSRESHVARGRVVRHIFPDALQETEHGSSHRLRKVVSRAHSYEIQHSVLHGTRLGLEGEIEIRIPEMPMQPARAFCCNDHDRRAGKTNQLQGVSALSYENHDILIKS